MTDDYHEDAGRQVTLDDEAGDVIDNKYRRDHDDEYDDTNDNDGGRAATATTILREFHAKRLHEKNVCEIAKRARHNNGRVNWGRRFVWLAAVAAAASSCGGRVVCSLRIGAKPDRGEIWCERGVE